MARPEKNIKEKNTEEKTRKIAKEKNVQERATKMVKEENIMKRAKETIGGKNTKDKVKKKVNEIAIEMVKEKRPRKMVMDIAEYIPKYTT
jgi:hypothetical protein